jgi:hypothetical protein
MITREEAKKDLSQKLQLGILKIGEYVDQLFDQHDKQITEYEEDLMSQGQIAKRALLIGYEAGWFEWKGDAENGGNFSSIETDLKKIRDNTKIYGYIKMMNAHTDALKNKISDLESQLSSDPLQLTCDGCKHYESYFDEVPCMDCIRKPNQIDFFTKYTK